MKFKSQHRNFSISVGGKKPTPYRAHRDGSSIWATTMDGITVFSRACATVRSAKAWINNPSIAA